MGLLAVTAWNLTRSEALQVARRAYARGELTAALRAALDHLDRRPWSREAARVAAACLSRLDFAEAAEGYYARAGTLDLNDLQIRAYGLVRGNHRAKAIRAYEQILERWPGNVTALRRLAAVQFSENNIPQLLGLADRLIKIPGGAPIGHTLRGAVAHVERDREIAVAAFDHVLEVDPELKLMPLPRREFWSFYAADLIKVGRSEDAERYLKRALEESPDAELMNTLGRAYLQQGRLDEAERCFKEAAEWDRKDATALFNLGKIDLMRKHFESARDHLEQAHRREPQRIDVLHDLSRAHRLLGQTAESARVDREIEAAGDRAKRVRKDKDPWPRYAL